MKVKVWFKDEIHRFSEMAASFLAFTLLILKSFSTPLPTHWVLKYTDSEGDTIEMSSQKDFEEYMKLESHKTNGAAKFYIVSANNAKAAVSQENDDVSQEQEIEEKQEEKSEHSPPSQPEEVPAPKETEPIKVKDKEVGNDYTVVEDSVQESVIIQSDRGQFRLSTMVSDASVVIDSNATSKKNVEIKKTLALIDALTEHLKALHQEGMNPHDGIMCNNCHALPIIGFRYKCTICPEYNLCALCECLQKHQHDFVKMRPKGIISSRYEVAPNEGQPPK